ncbi:hypothetical protein [Caudoviricetes sp.]|nr:hypothetical protein [Caudoviricetes sp.]
MIEQTNNWQDSSLSGPMREQAVGKLSPEQSKYVYEQAKRIDKPSDPWIHRSKGMRCDSCIWYVPKQRSEPGLAMEIGRCRRHAPTMNGYPVVYITDWCGDHRIDENKI